jgi:hypothetical protein
MRSIRGGRGRRGEGIRKENRGRMRRKVGGRGNEGKGLGSKIGVE